MKDLQKLRKRPHGVNIIGLAIGEKINSSNDGDSVSNFILSLILSDKHYLTFIPERFIQTKNRGNDRFTNIKKWES